MSFILSAVIYHALIVMDSMVHALLLSAIIDFSRSCVDLSGFNLFIMFMIYFWIMLKLKVLIYPTIPHYMCLVGVRPVTHYMESNTSVRKPESLLLQPVSH